MPIEVSHVSPDGQWASVVQADPPSHTPRGLIDRSKAPSSSPERQVSAGGHSASLAHAVSLTEQELQPLLNDEISLAAVNSPRKCVVSGPADAIEQFRQHATRRRVPCHPLGARRAFHSWMMDDVLGQPAENEQQVRINVLDAPAPERVGIPAFIDIGP